MLAADDGRRQARGVRARHAPARLGAAPRPHRGSRQVHLHRPQLQGPRGGDEQSRPQAAARVPQVDQCHRRSRRAGAAAARREDARLGGGAGGGDRPHGAVREAGAGARLRLRLHDHQRRERARLSVPHDASGARARSATRWRRWAPTSPTARRSRTRTSLDLKTWVNGALMQNGTRGTSSSTWATSSSTSRAS